MQEKALGSPEAEISSQQSEQSFSLSQDSRRESITSSLEEEVTEGGGHDDASSMPNATSSLINHLEMDKKNLSIGLQMKLDFDKIKLRIDNEGYIRRHPEINDILSYFVASTLETHPEDIKLHATRLLADENLREIVDQHKAKQACNLGDPSY
ncbi:MAG: hypothetical protein SGCHY_003426 [Lobulomycetales sp.]